MRFTTVPGIEYEVFLARLTLSQRMPRFGTAQTCVILGDSLSTLYVFRNSDGTATFHSHSVLEIFAFRMLVEQTFQVETLELP